MLTDRRVRHAFRMPRIGAFSISASAAADRLSARCEFVCRWNGRRIATDPYEWVDRDEAFGSCSDLTNREVRQRARPPTEQEQSSSTMSITTTESALSWKQADDHVHVATRDGEFAGFVELDGAVHVARDRIGTILGAYASCTDAQRAVERSIAGPARPRRFTLRRPRRARV